MKYMLRHKQEESQKTSDHWIRQMSPSTRSIFLTSRALILTAAGPHELTSHGRSLLRLRTRRAEVQSRSARAFVISRCNTVSVVRPASRASSVQILGAASSTCVHSTTLSSLGRALLRSRSELSHTATTFVVLLHRTTNVEVQSSCIQRSSQSVTHHPAPHAPSTYRRLAVTTVASVNPLVRASRTVVTSAQHVLAVHAFGVQSHLQNSLRGTLDRSGRERVATRQGRGNRGLDVSLRSNAADNNGEQFGHCDVSVEYFAL